MKYMVSYQLFGGDCGNKCGTKEEVKQYRNDHRSEWTSYSFFSYEPQPNGISDLIRVVLD
jgi:hypothetical protein